MIDRRTFLVGIATILNAPLATEAQRTDAIPTVGIMVSRPVPSRAFEDGLRELGWIEGKTIRFERRFSTDYRELPRLARQLVDFPVDIIFAGNAPATRAALDATATIPIVTVSGDPVSSGFVKSIGRPGGNVTGLAIMQPELSGKRLEILTAALPRVRLIAILANPQNPSTRPMLDETQGRARALGIDTIRFEETDPGRLPQIVADAARRRPDALVVLGDPMFTQNSARLVEAALQHRLPAMWEWRGFVDAGGLMAYAPNADELNRRAATYVDRVLKGAKPGDLPVERATKFELIINLKTARALGLTIPPALLLRADQVIE